MLEIGNRIKFRVPTTEHASEGIIVGIQGEYIQVDENPDSDGIGFISIHQDNVI